LGFEKSVNGADTLLVVASGTACLAASRAIHQGHSGAQSTAKALEITVPLPVLSRADEAIE